MKHTVYLGIGTNIEPHRHVAIGLDELDAEFDLFAISSVFQSAAIGFEGSPFLNLVAGVRTSASVSELHASLRNIEYAFGRSEACTKYSSRTLDIDLLTFDQLAGVHAGIDLPREEITRNAFVLAPFAEIAPDLILPGRQSCLRQLWQRFDDASQIIERVDFSWRGQALPCRTSLVHRPTSLS